MDILKRTLAPITDAAWQEIDEEAMRVLRGMLSARKLVDFAGPEGIEKAAVNLGTLNKNEKELVKGVGWGIRQVQPLIECRVPFSLNIWDLDNVERGSKEPDLDKVSEAARKMALFEETAVYLGFEEACIVGICPAAAKKIPFPKNPAEIQPAIEEAVLTLQKRGINGGYQLVLGTEAYRLVKAGDDQGYPLHRRIQELVGSDIIWSPALTVGALISVRGGDFLFTSGQDLAIGYHAHDHKNVELFLTESFTFQVFEPNAAVAFDWQ